MIDRQIDRDDDDDDDEDDDDDGCGDDDDDGCGDDDDDDGCGDDDDDDGGQHEKRAIEIQYDQKLLKFRGFDVVLTGCLGAVLGGTKQSTLKPR